MASEARGSRSQQQFKTPRSYKSAAIVLQGLDDNASLNTLLYSLKGLSSFITRVQAIVSKIVAHRAELQFVISKTEINKELNVQPHLLEVLVFEQLFNKKTIPGNSKTAWVTRDNREALESALAEYHSVNSGNDDSHRTSFSLPRYARVNTLKTTTSAVVTKLINEGFRKIDYADDISYRRFKKMVKRLEEDEFVCDMHVADLLVFHPKVKFHSHPLYVDGKLILQDKASCFSSLLLRPKANDIVLDACAAPGMKTSHLAAMLQNNGDLLAYDVSADRVREMEEMLAWYNVTCVTSKVVDFTSLKVEDMPYKNVKRILVDPSCSGSGMVKRNMAFHEDPSDADRDRIANLATFQCAMLSKALTFPSVKRVVYSTCSVYRSENENVVKKVLKQFGDQFRLVKPKQFSHFLNSNENDEALQNRCLRFHPQLDFTNGFFVAVFVRRKVKADVWQEDPISKRAFEDEEANDDENFKSRQENGATDENACKTKTDENTCKTKTSKRKKMKLGQKD